jgi:hypothetical protein
MLGFLIVTIFVLMVIAVNSQTLQGDKNVHVLP